MAEFVFWEQLEKLYKYFELPEIFRLKELTNFAMKEAALENSRIIAKIAIVSYCLHKLLTKEHIVQNKNWQKVRKSILGCLEKAIISAKQNNFLEMEKSLDSAIRNVNEIDSDLGFFLTSLLDKAKIKLASGAYSMGLSLGQSAELTGTDKKQLLQYVANTTISEEEKAQIGIAERLAKIKKIMKEKAK